MGKVHRGGVLRQTGQLSSCACERTSRRLAPEGMRRGAGRVGPFSLVDMDAAFAAPRSAKGLSAAIPQIASLPEASPTFSRHDGAMLRVMTKSCITYRGGAMLRMDGSPDEGRAYGP